MMVVSFRQTLLSSSLGEVEFCTDCFSTKYKWRLEVNHHRSCHLGDSVDHLFDDPVLVLSIGRVWFVYCTTSGEHQSEGFVVMLSSSTIAPKLYYFVSNGVKWSLEAMVW
jgi:hypothetical protein